MFLYVLCSVAPFQHAILSEPFFWELDLYLHPYFKDLLEPLVAWFFYDFFCPLVKFLPINNLFVIHKPLKNFWHSGFLLVFFDKLSKLVEF